MIKSNKFYWVWSWIMIMIYLQKMRLAGFSRGIHEMHRKASLVLEDAVRNIYSVVAFCAGNRVMELYRLQPGKTLKQSFLHGMGIGFAFGFLQFLFFSCNGLLRWYTSVSVRHGHLTIATAVEKIHGVLLCDLCTCGAFWPCPIYTQAAQVSLFSIWNYWSGPEDWPWW